MSITISSPPAEFELYMRSGCHLCEDLYEMILPYQASHRIKIKLFDIDSSRELQKLYGLKIPVLVYQGQEICHYYFDQKSFLSVLEKL